MDRKEKILVVLAHPDDESFGMGGTLALYASKGHEIHYICLTRGEAGDVDSSFMENYETIADLRTAELMCASKHLGLAHVEFFDYCDSGMAGSDANGNVNSLIKAPKEEVVERTVRYIRKFKPDIVLTFDPDGGYKHPDHIYAHQITVDAFEKAADGEMFPDAGEAFQSKKLLFHYFSKRFFRFYIKVLNFFGVNTTEFGKNKDINLNAIVAGIDYPSHYKINYKSAEEMKNKASDCHASQQHPGRQSNPIMSLIFKLMGGKDEFSQMYPKVGDNFRSKDLFS